MTALLVCAWLAAPHAAADDPRAEPRAVTLPEAVAAAAAQPELAAALAAERAAAAAVRSAGVPGDGAVSLSTYSVTARASLSATFPLPLERGARLRAARSGLVIAERSRAESLALAQRELRAAWFSLAAAEARSRAGAERAQRAARTLAAVEAMFEAGRVSRLDRVRASADAALARSEGTAAEETRATAAARLALLMGWGALAPVATTGEPARPVAEPELPAYLQRVQATSPALRVQDAQVSSAEARLALTRRLRWPNLALSGGASWSDPTQPGTDKWIGIGVGVPFGGGAAVALASAERDQEAAVAERERRSVLDAAQSAWRNARSARLRFEAVEDEVLPAAREAAELTALAYREGRADLFRVLDAERALTDAALLRADALETWGGAHADVLRLAGEEEP